MKALELLRFVEYEHRVTHDCFWALRDDAGGTGAVVRLAGFERVPTTQQLRIMEDGRISVHEWLLAVAQAEQILSPPQN